MLQFFDTLQDENGNALGVGSPYGVGSVVVTAYPGGGAATIYSDNGLTVIASSTVTADITGQVSFFAPDGNYIVTYNNNGTTYKARSPVTMFDGAAQVTFTDTGSVNALAITSSALEKQLRAGLRAYVKVAVTNTGAATLAYNGLAAKAITFPYNTPVSAGALVASGIYGFEYDGIQWQVRDSNLFAIPTSAAETAASLTPSNYLYAPGNVLRYGAANNTDSTVAFQAAVAQYKAGGAPVYAPAGTYIITSSVTLATTGLFTPGLRIYGDGQALTIIDNRVGSGSCFVSAGAAVISNWQEGGYIRDLQILTTTSPASSNGIELQSVYNYEIRNVWIKGMTGDGVRITCTVGDADASNQVLLQNCRIENCNIGLNSNFSSGLTQPSFISAVKCFFQGCTTAGWKYAGGNGRMDNCAFAAMNCPGLWLWYNSANNPQFSSNSTTFENCGSSTQPSLKIDSLNNGNFVETEIANTVTIGGSAPISGVLLGNVSGLASNIVFDSTYVRIGSAFNPFTLWNLGANAQYVRVRNTQWQSYDGTGQVRYADSGNQNVVTDGFLQQPIGASGSNNLTFALTNVNFALPLDGTVFQALTSAAANFSIDGFTNGFSGRELILINSSGYTMTLNANGSGGSTAANQIRFDAGTPVTIGIGGAARLMYVNSRWQFMGHG